MNISHSLEVEKPLVSIICLTYNMEQYIKQTIESLLMQRTTFSFEIIIHDDASTDSTKRIIEDYALKYPAIIKPLYQEENKLSKSGFHFQYSYVFPKAQGNYIVFCDGDDYWIDPLKVQKQVDFLESNPDFGLVHTKAAKYYDERDIFEGVVGHEFMSFEELITECTVAHSSVCYRNNLIKQYIEEVKPQERINWTTNDFPVWLWFIQNTKIKLLEDFTTVYRQRNDSISHIEDDFKRLRFLEGVYDVVHFYLSEYSGQINEDKIKSRYYSNLINNYFLTRKWDGVRKSIKIFYNANDWINLLWIAFTFPFSFSKFLIKGSYRVRSIIFRVFNFYPVKE